MSEDEKETEQPNEMINLNKTILEFNNQNQEGKGLKILTPDQMISGLPISLYCNYYIVFNCIFVYSANQVKYFLPSISNTAQYCFTYILN